MIAPCGPVPPWSDESSNGGRATAGASRSEPQSGDVSGSTAAGEVSGVFEARSVFVVHTDDDDEYFPGEEEDVDPMAASRSLQPMGVFDEADFDDEFDADFDDSDVAEEDRELDAELLEAPEAEEDEDELDPHLVEEELKNEALVDEDDLRVDEFPAGDAVPPTDF